MSVSTQLVGSLDGIPGELRQAVIREFHKGEVLEMAQGEAHQIRIGKTNHRRERRSLDGLGRLRMSIDPALFHAAGQKYGYACWRDEGFLRDVERDEPAVKVKCGGTRIQSGYSSGGDSTKRFQKVYA